MKTVKLLKPHLGKKAGTSVPVSDEQANYMQRVGLIEGSTEDKVAPKQKKEIKTEKAVAKKPATITTKSVKNLPAKKKK